MAINNSLHDVALMGRALRLTEGFAQWPPPAIARLLSSSHLAHYSKGDFISSERTRPETLAIVAGHVVMRRSADGSSRSMVGLVGPGRVVGLTRALVNDDDAYDFVAFDDTTVVHLPSTLLLEIANQEPMLWKDIALVLLKNERQTISTLIKRMSGSLQRRLAATLESLADLYGVAQNGGLRIRLRLTQDDLASFLQVARQTINKDLKALAERGLISADHSTITVLDMAGLRNLANQA